MSFGSCWRRLKKSGPTSSTPQPLEPPKRLFSPNHMVSSANNLWGKRGGPAVQICNWNIGVEYSAGQLTFSNGTDGDFYHSWVASIKSVLGMNSRGHTVMWIRMAPIFGGLWWVWQGYIRKSLKLRTTEAIYCQHSKQWLLSGTNYLSTFGTTREKSLTV